MSTKHYCDRCGSEMTVKGGRFEVHFTKIKNWSEETSTVVEDFYRRDMCGRCVNQVLDKHRDGPRIGTVRLKSKPKAKARKKK